MGGEIIELTNGENVEIKVNFGTMYYLQKCGGTNLAKRLEKKQKKKKHISDDENMEMAAKIIYSILRSNGQKVTFDEALELLYPDTETIGQVLEAYNKEVERIKKKEESKKNLKKVI